MEKYRHKLYKTWISMKQRCYNPNSYGYTYYGGRGIIVCDRWKTSFKNFLEDMGERPEGHSLDRINNNGNYEPSNCRWATSKEQSNNKRYYGNKVSKTLIEKGYKKGINHHNASITEQQVKAIKTLLSFNERNRDIAKFFNISYQTVCDIKKGRRWKEISYL